MMWQTALLSVLAILAGFLFIVGSFEAFQGSRTATRRRGKKRRKRPMRKLEDVMMEATLPPPQHAFVRAPGPAPALASREVAWSGRAPAAPAVAEIAKVDEPSPAEGAPSKIVAHYADGKLLKGFSQDFYPNKPAFHLLPATTGFSFTEEAVDVWIQDLKAVFFVKDFAGNPAYHERKHFVEGENPPGRKVRVVFKDGEVMVGSTVGYERQRPAFFMIPADPQSNNRSVFVVVAATTNIRFL